MSEIGQEDQALLHALGRYVKAKPNAPRDTWLKFACFVRVDEAVSMTGLTLTVSVDEENDRLRAALEMLQRELADSKHVMPGTDATVPTWIGNILSGAPIPVSAGKPESQ